MRIKEILNQRFSAAMQAAGVPSECSPILALSGKPQFGDYQANGAMAAAKRLKMNPRDLAEKIIQHADLDGIADRLEIAGPGFINIHLCDAFLTAIKNDTPSPIASDELFEVARRTIDISLMLQK